MHQDLDPGILFAELMDVGSLEHLVDRAVPLPQDHFRVLDGLLAVSAVLFFVRVPHGHLGIGNSHLKGRVSTEVLVGEEKHPLALSEGPIKDRFGIAACTDDTAMFSAEGFEARGAVDVGHRGEISGVDHFGELAPSRLDLTDCGHIGHRTSGGHVRQHDGDALTAALFELLGSIGQDVSRLGHEVHTAENDVAAIGAFSSELAQLVRVARQVCMLDDFVLLVMVPEDEQAFAEGLLRLRDPLAKFLVAQLAIGSKGFRRVEGCVDHAISQSLGRVVGPEGELLFAAVVDRGCDFGFETEAFDDTIDVPVFE